MTIVQIQLSPWDKISSLVDTLGCQLHHPVVVKTELGLDLAQVIDRFEADAYAPLDTEVELVRLATTNDMESALDNATKTKALQECHAIIKQVGLAMKLVDLKVSLDGGRLTFAFVANGRIDFRDLVKDLTKHFNKTIRLQQIGIRDEAKLIGDQGRCGMGLCCKGHLQKFTSVTSDMAEVQNLASRGSDRLSGACGRLMCCLAYEAEGYKEALSQLPAIDAKVVIDGKRGTVVGHHTLKGTVDVRLPGEKGEHDYIVEVVASKIKQSKPNNFN